MAYGLVYVGKITIMKKIFTLLAIIICSTAISFASFKPSNRLTIAAAGNFPIRVTIDGVKYKNNSSDFSITNISNGFHQIKVFRVIDAFNFKKSQLLYIGSVMIKPNLHTDVIINRFGKAFVDEKLIAETDYYDEDDDNWVYNGDQGEDYFAHHPIINANFIKLKQAIKSQSFDDEKLSIAQQAIKDNYFTADQVKELMMLFGFDEKKLSVAKLAYKNTVDKGNYFIVYDAFTFNTYKQDLIKYLETEK